MKRLIEPKLQEWKRQPNRKPLLVRGVRQCGKTTSLIQFGKSFRKCHILNFEKNKTLHAAFDGDLKPSSIIKNLELLLDRDIDTASDLLFLDEIQECPKAISSLKYFCEDLPEFAVCAAGSHIGVTSASASFPIGKVSFLNMFPMNFAEFLMNFSERLFKILSERVITEETISPLAHEKLSEALKYYWITGGMPEAIKCFLLNQEKPREAFKITRRIHEALIEGYISDFAKHCEGLNAQHIHLVFKNIPEQLQKIRDGSSKRYHFKGVIPNRSKYTQLSGPIEWLSHCGLALKINQLECIQHPLNAYAKENFFRLFLFDVGLLNTLLNYPAKQILGFESNSYDGFIAENYIAQELRTQEIPFFTFNELRSEVEFILDYHGSILPIEVKAGKNLKSQSLAKFKERYAPEISIKFSNKPLRVESEQLSIPLYLSSFINTILDLS